MYEPPSDIQQKAHISSIESYKQAYELSINDPSKFWGRIAEDFFWKEVPEKESSLLSYNFDCTKGDVFIKFMAGRKTNLCYNSVDINLKRNLGDKIAFYW